MILVLAGLALVAATVLRGGDLRRLAEGGIRGANAALVALAVQIAVISAWPGGSHRLHALLHLSTYVIAGGVVLGNRRIRGVPLLGLGGAMNFIAIAANGGVMPSTHAARAIAGLGAKHGFSNSGALAHPQLLWLGDVFAFPGPAHVGNVFSAGDVLIVVGLGIALAALCGSVPGRRPGRALDS